jgi:hypothetical protein
MHLLKISEGCPGKPQKQNKANNMEANATAQL